MMQMRHDTETIKTDVRLMKVVIIGASSVICTRCMYVLRESDVEVLDTIQHGGQMTQLMHKFQPDILILDLNLPGVENIVHLIQSFPLVKVLITSTLVEPASVLNLLDAGIAGYILNDEITTSLALALQVVARGQVWLSSTIVMSALRRQESKIALLEQYPLSHREWQVINLLADAKTNKEMSSLLHMTERTVRFHLRNIYDKISVANRSQATVWAVQNGLGTQQPAWS